MNACHNCGLPDWAISHPGVETKLHLRAHNHFARDSKRTVWCCSESCALQARAQAEMGAATHNWPMTLAEYSAHERATTESRSKRPENTSQVPDSKQSKTAKNEVMALRHTEAQIQRISGRGRPRIWENERQRKRAYRAGRKATALELQENVKYQAGM